MRLLAKVLATALIALPLFAQEHHHHHAVPQQKSVVVRAVEPTGVTRTYTIVAHQWAFDITPLPFVADAGDTVVLNISTRDVAHGFFMERYVTQGLVLKSSPQTVTFTADQTGEFTFFCTLPSCGSGHNEMDGSFVVSTATNPAPAITSIAPLSGTTAGGTVVTITGSNFVSGATVTFGSAQATSVNVQNATTIVATAPAQPAGDVTITVKNPDGQTATFSGFNYAAPSLGVTAVSPSSGPSNGGTQITITGTAFAPGATVTIGTRSALNVNVVNATTITATTPAAPANETQLQPLAVTVRNSDGTSATLDGGFHYTNLPLAITAISPSTGITTGGTEVTITGTGFSSALAGLGVTFGGVAATNVTVLDAATISATTPAHAAGAVPVVVTVGGNSASLNGTFTFAESQPRRRSVRH